MDNTPDSPAKTPEGYTTQGGNFWTLITPEIWKFFHAVLHSFWSARMLPIEEALGHRPATSFDPILISICAAVAIIGLSCATIYRIKKTSHVVKVI